MIIELKDTVEKILKEHQSARDDSLTLYEFYLNRCLISKTTPINEIFAKIRADEISSIESVSRCSRLIQNSRPELRGKLYEDRHKKAEEVKKELSKEK